MIAISLFHSSAKDEEGDRIVKALVHGDIDTGEAETISNWMNDAQKHVLVLDDDDVRVRWVG